MVKNKTRQKPVNAWVSLCLVTKRLANWGELLSVGSEVQILSGTPKTPLQAVFCWFAAFFILLLPARRSFAAGRSLCAATVYSAKRNRTVSTGLLRKIASLLIGFFGLTCRWVPLRAAQPGYLPVPAIAGAAPPEPPDPAWPVPVPLVLPGDEPPED